MERKFGNKGWVTHGPSPTRRPTVTVLGKPPPYLKVELQLLRKYVSQVGHAASTHSKNLLVLIRGTAPHVPLLVMATSFKTQQAQYTPQHVHQFMQTTVKLC